MSLHLSCCAFKPVTESPIIILLQRNLILNFCGENTVCVFLRFAHFRCVSDSYSLTIDIQFSSIGSLIHEEPAILCPFSNFVIRCSGIPQVHGVEEGPSGSVYSVEFSDDSFIPPLEVGRDRFLHGYSCARWGQAFVCMMEFLFITVLREKIPKQLRFWVTVLFFWISVRRKLHMKRHELQC